MKKVIIIVFKLFAAATSFGQTKTPATFNDSLQCWRYQYSFQENKFDKRIGTVTFFKITPSEDTISKPNIESTRTYAIYFLNSFSVQKFPGTKLVYAKKHLNAGINDDVIVVNNYAFIYKGVSQITSIVNEPDDYILHSKKMTNYIFEQVKKERVKVLSDVFLQFPVKRI